MALAIAERLKELVACRDTQIDQLAVLLNPHLPNPSTVCIHGVEATGKTLTIEALLDALPSANALVRSHECITQRHLLEGTIARVDEALQRIEEESPAVSVDGRCESISAFVVQLQLLLKVKRNFVLVFDGVDRQREAAPTLLPALARLGEIIPSLTVVFIVTVPHPGSLHQLGVPFIHFPPYDRAQILSIVSASPLPLHPKPPRASLDPEPPEPDEDAAWLWPRFCGAVWDSLGQGAARDIPSFRTVCSRLWLPFIQPISDGQYGTRDFSKLMVRNRSLFQSEAALTERLIPKSPDLEPGKSKPPKPPLPLPLHPTHLLLAAYLASHNPPRLDQALFTKTSERRKRRRNPNTAPNHRKTSHRKINRRLLGPQAFFLERWLAIFHALLLDTVGVAIKGGGADVVAQIATLLKLGLVVRAGTGDGELGGGKWRVNVGWEVVSGLARGVGVETENYLVE